MKKIIYIILTTIALTPVFAYAQTAVPAGQSEYSGTAQQPTYVLLAPLPCVGATTGSTCTSNGGASEVTTIGIQGYLIYVFKLMISLAVFLAVIMIIVSGFRYMTVESVTGKEGARHMIENAVYGLLLALASYLILYTINPNFVDLTTLVAVPKLNVQTSSSVMSSLQATQQLELSNTNQTNTLYNSNAVTVTQLQTDQNNVESIQDQITSCNDGETETNCNVTQLQSQLATAQNQLTTDTNSHTTQTALGEIDNSTALGAGAASQSSLTPSGQDGVIQQETSAINADAAAATSNLTNDPTDTQLINDTATVKDFELLDSGYESNLSGTVSSISGTAQSDIVDIKKQITQVNAMTETSLQQEFIPYANQIIAALQTHVQAQN